MRYTEYQQGEGLNWWETDPNLQQTVARYTPDELAAWAWPHLSRFGELCGTKVSPRADLTDRQEGRPRLQSYDRQGDDISRVLYNPGYLQTVADVYGSGIVAWRHRQPETAPGKVPPAVTYAMGYLVSMAESGYYCPVVLTAACAHVLERYGSRELQARYLPGLTATDPTQLLQGATWLTEKTGGSDVGAITTVARKTGDTWRLTGEKWFASNADAPVALVLARPEGAPAGTAGLALFLVPRTLPDGSRNQLRIRRLKEKLGVIAVPSGEVLLEGAVGYLVGDPGQGFKQMMEGLNLSRVMNAIGSAGLARRAVLESLIYTANRIAFGKPLNQHPLMRVNLLDMAVEQEAITTLAFRAADCFERGEPLHRLLIPIAKARCADRAVRIARAGIECFGGNGYIEDYSVMPRLLRDAQVLTVWEGPENILALDCLRVLASRGAGDLFDELERRLAGVTRPDLAVEKAHAEQGVAHLVEGLTAAAGAHPDWAQLQAVRLLNLMADLLCSAYLLEEAERDDRKAAVARWYIHRLQPRSDWDPASPIDRLALEQFATIVGG